MGRRVLLTVAVPLLLAVSVAFASAPSSAATAKSQAPRIPGGDWTGPPTRGVHGHVTPGRRAWLSPNWSGYAASGSGITSVVGHWTVPTVQPPLKRGQLRRNQYSGTWVGIDGFNNRSLIQAGTEQDWMHGKTFYQAWWEILPAPETPIPSVPVRPGDSITVTITKGALWTITLTDNTTGNSYTTNQSYSGPGTSAEWIHEAVTVGRRVSRLPRDTAVTFDAGMVNGAPASLVPSDAGAIVQAHHQVSTPSAPDSDNDGFTVAYGSAVSSPSAS